MGLIKKENIEFVFDFFEKNKVPELYSSISYSHTNETFYHSTNNDYDIDNTTKIHSIQLIPDYIQLQLKHQPLFKIKSLYQFSGYSIVMDKFLTADEYLNSHFKSKFRTAVYRYVKRLEMCFDINYKMFYGKIEKEEYDFLMGSLKKMLEKRFKQRNNVNERLHEWDHFHKIIFPLINQKKASLFVIYDEEKPIDISLNYHHDKIFFSAIASYDIDYAKFGLGHIDIYKQLEWCISNHYQIFDLGMGDMDYKYKWCNTIYKFNHHFIYNKRSIYSILITSFLIKKIIIKQYLKDKNIDVQFKKFISLFKRNKKKPFTLSNQIHCEITDISDFPPGKSLLKVNIKKHNYLHISKILYDFLYTNSENINNVNVYIVDDNPHSFIIEGKKRQFIKILQLKNQE